MELRIIYSNARSIIGKINELKALAVEANPSIIAITEAWTNANIDNSFLEILGYKLVIRKDRSDTSDGKGGGILVYAKKEIDCHEIDSPLDVIQLASLRIRVEDNNFDLHVVYRPPKCSDENNVKLNDFIKGVRPNTILIGDFNYPDVDWELMSCNLGPGADFIDAVCESYLTQHVEFATHERGNILDLVLSNIPNRVQSVSEHGKIGNSDHFVICAEIEAAVPAAPPKRTTWNYAKAKFADMRNELLSKRWNDLMCNDVNLDWMVFKEIFFECCNKFIPKKSVRESIRPAWLKQDTLRLVRQKRAAWKRYRLSQNQEDFASFKELEKRVKKAVKNSKHNYERKIAKNAKSNPKQFYAYLNTKKQNRVHLGPIKDESGELQYEDLAKAQILNNHYSKVFTTESDELPDICPQIECQVMPEINFARSEIEDILKQLKDTGSSGPDEINQKILKTVAAEVSLPLALLFAKSMRLSNIPDDWKNANVIPIFKKGSKVEPGNYRPISLTSVVVKVMERLLKERIIKHLLSNNLMKPSQHGFLPKRSTTTNLVTYIDFLTNELDKGQPVDVLYLDFAKAFDKVPHKRLIQKLKWYRLDMKVIQWIEAWLRDRKQRVIVNGVPSDWADVISSVIQGSVLGPILFTIYINDVDICLHPHVGFISKFADDTKVAKVINDESSAFEMQAIINNLGNWSRQWEMKFNLEKCCILHFGFNNQKYQYTMNGAVLQSESQQKDLGIIITDSCKPSEQCAAAAKKANQVLGRINRAFSCYTKDIMLQIYKVFVRPHLEYAVSAWSPWLKKDIEALEKIQRRATRRVSDIRGNYPERLEQLDLTTLEERRSRGDAIETYKYLHRIWNIDSSALFTLVDPERPLTRQQQSFMPLIVPRARLDIRKYAFSVRSAKLWNEIPSETREASSLNIFKNMYDRNDHNSSQSNDSFD